MILNKKVFFNYFSYIFFLIIDKTFEYLKLNQKKFYAKLEHSTFYAYKKQNLLLNLKFNLKVNLLRFKKIKNFDLFKNIFNEKYFFSTRTNFYKKNEFYKKKKFSNYKKLFPLIKKSKYIIHLGSSTSCKNLIFSNHCKSKFFFQTDKSYKVTVINQKLFSNIHRVNVLKIDILDLPFFIKKHKLCNLLIYSETSLMYLPKKKILKFLKDISKFKRVTVVFGEPGNNKIISELNFKNALIFEHDYFDIFKKSKFFYQKLFSSSNLHVAKNY